MIVKERCALFGEVRRGVSLMAPVLKQSFCNSVWIEQRTKTKITVPKTCKSHVGGVDHNDCLVGKYATGVKENVVLGTVHTDGR
jgi:hypothetical protein